MIIIGWIMTGLSFITEGLKLLFSWAIFRAGKKAQVAADQSAELKVKDAELQAATDAPKSRQETIAALDKGEG